MKIVQKAMLTTLLLVSAISTANASSVTYDYVGRAFDTYQGYDASVGYSSTFPSTIGPRITGSATFADGIDNTVTSYMLTDGINTLDSSNVSQYQFNMDFVNNNVNSWSIYLVNNYYNTNNYSFLNTVRTNNYSIDQSIIYSLNTDGGYQNFDFAYNQYQPGTWTLHQDEVSSVPVPAALPLMASALGLFGFAKRRKQSV